MKTLSGIGITENEAVNIFTDGSSYPQKKGNSGVGIHIIWYDDNGDERFKDASPTGWKSATNNAMEIQACIIGLQEAQFLPVPLEQFKKIIIFTDSQYVYDNYNNAMYNWPKNRWKKKTDQLPVKNLELWKKLKKEVSNIDIKVKMEKVKAHKKDKHNKIADKLAKDSASRPYNESLRKGETTRKWSNRSTVKGCIDIDENERIIRIISRDSIPKTDLYEYRYEIIDPDDKDFEAIDFIYHNEYLHRNKCLVVKLCKKNRAPYIQKIILDIDCKQYKH